MNESEITKSICYGCSACASICPQSAISMRENNRGFLYPVIDKNKCTDCEKCKKTCEEIVKKQSVQKTYLIKTRNSYQHRMSQSGGAFSAISDVVLRQGGSVFGVATDEQFEGEYKKAITIAERDRMHGSKYMQARVGKIYREVEEEITNNKVLFTGTPCLVSGLLKYLKQKRKDCRNLYTVDLICHGVPSVLIWRSFIRIAEQRVGKIKCGICRDKIQTGWGGSMSSFWGNNLYTTTAFCKMFFTDLCLRDSCYHCEFASSERCGDITIGDAWGVRKNNPEFADSLGVSLMMVNSEKGEELFAELSDMVDSLKVSLTDYEQKNLVEPSKPHRNVDEFWKDYYTRDFSYMINKYSYNNILLNFKYAVKRGLSIIWQKK